MKNVKCTFFFLTLFICSVQIAHAREYFVMGDMKIWESMTHGIGTTEVKKIHDDIQGARTRKSVSVSASALPVVQANPVVIGYLAYLYNSQRLDVKDSKNKLEDLNKKILNILEQEIRLSGGIDGQLFIDRFVGLSSIKISKYGYIESFTTSTGEQFCKEDDDFGSYFVSESGDQLAIESFPLAPSDIEKNIDWVESVKGFEDQKIEFEYVHNSNRFDQFVHEGSLVLKKLRQDKRDLIVGESLKIGIFSLATVGWAFLAGDLDESMMTEAHSLDVEYRAVAMDILSEVISDSRSTHFMNYFGRVVSPKISAQNSLSGFFTSRGYLCRRSDNKVPRFQCRHVWNNGTIDRNTYDLHFIKN